MSNRVIPITFALANAGNAKQFGSIEEILEWFRKAEFRAIGREDVELGFVLGEKKPGPDHGHLPWLDTSSDPAVWRIQRGGKWQPVHDHRKGTLQTRVRLAGTVAEEITNGWVLCDANNPLNVDLTEVPGFFAGTAPDWTVYTVAFVGYGDV